jgi:hypothetical protein
MAALIGLALGGCAHFDALGGEKYPENDMSSTCRKLRPAEPEEEAWGLSNKSLQISRDLGYH